MSEETLPFDAARLSRLGRVGPMAPAPDGTWAAVAVARLDPEGSKYVSDLWRVSLSEASAAPVQLTRGASNDVRPRFRRDGSLAFLSNRNPRDGKPEEGDEERTQVWLLPHAGGEPQPLTDEPLGVSDFGFAAGADLLVVVADVLPGVPHDEQRKQLADRQKRGPSALRYRQMPVRHWDHWLGPATAHLVVYDEHGGQRRDLTPDAQGEYRECEWDVSADGRWIAITKRVPGPDRIDDVPLQLVDAATGASSVIGAEPRVQHAGPLFSPDGAMLACSRERRYPDACPTSHLYLYEAPSGRGRVLAESWDRWAVPQAWVPDGSSLVVMADDRGQVPVFAVDVRSAEVTRITADGEGGSHADLHVIGGGTAVVGVRSRFVHPPEPFRVALRSDARPQLLARLSGFDPAEADEWLQWESLTVRSDDGADVQTFLLTPRSGESPHPLVLWIHGGPIGQWADGWHWRWNPLVPVAAGYAIALSNPRGSTGFGYDFIAGIWNNAWGGQCYRDLMRTMDALVARPDVDGERTAAMGGSFGGYMVNWIGGNTDRFRCLVTHASLFDLSAFYGVTDEPGWFALELGGNPHDDAEQFERHSPHRHIKRWKSPTLIIHGEKDFRVPVSEALALFEGLRRHDVQCELVVFPDENHWILKPRNVEAWYAAVLEFLAEHV